MCNFFSCVVTKDGRLLFTEEDQHEETIQRAGLQDNDVFLRSFVRLECLPPFDNVVIDEPSTLPGWFDTDEWQDRVIDLAQRVYGFALPSQAIRDSACADYYAIRNPAYVDYQAICDPALADYNAIRNPAYVDYKDPALADYQAIRDSAWADYEAICDLAFAGYEAICASAQAELVKQLAEVTGYTPA